MMSSEKREYEFVQKPFIEQLKALDYQYIEPKKLESEREGLRSVILKSSLKNAICRLNQWLPEDKIDEVLKVVLRDLENPAQPDLVRCNEVVHSILVNGAKVQLNLGGGLKYYTIKLIDFENPEQNEFIVTDSLPGSSFDVQGINGQIKPDIVIFVNGIPLVVVEAKDPTMQNKDPIEEAISQLNRYQKNAPQLFYPNLFVVATCGLQCEYAPIQGKFERWKDEEVEKELQKQLRPNPTSQEVFIACLFPKENLLEFLRDFVAYGDEPPKGKVKKIARHMQWRAVKNAIQSARQARQRSDGRGGTIWHWQGSGKTLTMLWLALKLRREFNNPCIIILTDRRELDNQIKRVLSHHGFPNPYHATSVKHLKELLKNPTGKTILVTLQKLGSKILSETGETEHLSEEKNIFVLADEAHRSQYALLAARMRNLLPGATFFAFTGTPLEKEDRNTPQVFGDYLDRYTIKDALEDGVTVKIIYQARLPKLHLKEDIDEQQAKIKITETLVAQVEERMEHIAEDIVEQQAKIKITETLVAQVEERMRRIAEDIVEHFLSEVEPKGFKAMVVAHGRWMAVRYKELVDGILKQKECSNIETAAIITVGQNEPWAEPYKRTEEEEQRLINRFRDPNDPLKILFVSDKLLTGFDAPILGAMYLDKRLREHTLLQAVARVNRPCKLEKDGKEITKEYGLILDYFGIAGELKEALEKYENVEGLIEEMEDTGEWLKQLEEIHEMASSFFSSFDLSKSLDSATLQQCIEELQDDQKRDKFAQLVREYGKLLNLVLPDHAGLKFAEPYKRLVQIRQAAYRIYYDRRLRQIEFLPKLMQIMNDAVKVGELDLTDPAEITSEAFLSELEKEPEEVQVRKTSSALRVYINAHIDEDPDFYQPLQKQVEGILQNFDQRNIEARKVVKQLLAFREEILKRQKETEKLGISERQVPFFNFLRSQGLSPEKAKELVEEIEQAIREVYVPDWVSIESARQKVRAAIYRCLKGKDISKEKAEEWQKELLKLAEIYYWEI
ncbi:MAG: type I restriction endonuclease subunit R [Caldisericaceae bacterium]